ncbi:MAG TPA: TonB-dependent receptor, partial [Nevskiaceae bacterium]|nr:TonB-dependent receptor [Nevskiaceae bacterium]
HQRSEMGQPEAFGASCRNGAHPPDPQHCTDGLGYADTDGDPYKGDWRGDFPYNVDQLGETLIADWDLGAATLTSVTGYIDFKRNFHIDTDGSPADEFDFFQTDTVKQTTQELRLSGGHGAAQWLAGVFWSRDDIHVHDDGRHEDAIPGEFSTIEALQGTRSAAAFGNVDWKLSERWTLTSGLRYTHESRDYSGGTHWTVPVPGTIASTSTDSSIHDSNWSWKLGASFAPTHTSLIYANASKGVKSGGYFSGVTTDSAQLQPYLPEQLVAYEIGAKTQGAFALNASVFYYDYKNVQTFMRNASAPVQLIGNVPKASTMGLDAEAILRALDGLTLQTGVGLLHTRLGSFDGPDGSPVAAGNQLPNSPRITFNGLARYEFPLFSEDVLGALQADAHYSASAFKEATDDPVIHQDPYWIFNARVGVLSASRVWEVAAWGRNLTNKLYVVQGLDVGSLFFGNRNYNAPRTAGVEFSVKF